MRNQNHKSIASNSANSRREPLAVRSINSTCMNSSARFPRHIPIRQFSPVDMEKIIEATPALAGTALPVLQTRLKNRSPFFYDGLRTTRVGNSSLTSIAETVEVFPTDLNSAPSHMLAVYNPRAPRRVHLYPVHALLMEVLCTKLPAIPRKKYPAGSLGSVTIPTMHLALPSIDTFPTILIYCYSKSTEKLIHSLAPPTIATASYKELSSRLTIVGWVYQNACALGMTDPQFWSALDCAWGLLLAAFERRNA